MMQVLSNAFLGARMKLTIAAPAPPPAAAPRQVTCMAKKKGVRCIITLECTESRAEGATPSRYVTQKVLHVAPEMCCEVHMLAPCKQLNR